MNQFFQSAFTEALGWSLADSLWQAGILWLLYILITGNGKSYSALIRHNLAFYSLLAATLWFFISFGIHYWHALDHTGRKGFIFIAGFREVLAAVMPYVSILYLLIVFWMLLKISWKLVAPGKKLCGTLITPAAEVSDILRRLGNRISIGKKVELWFSDVIHIPATMGCLQPVILLPFSIVTQLTSAQLEAVIAHELFHIRRNDYLHNILTIAAGTILFFNPFARIIVSLIGKERENHCDDQVLGLGFEPWDYAQALFILGKNASTSTFPYAVAATGNEEKYLLFRVRRMLRLDTASPSLLKPLATFFLCLFVAVFSFRRPSVDQPEPLKKPVTAIASPGKKEAAPVGVDIQDADKEIVSAAPSVRKRVLTNKGKKEKKVPDVAASAPDERPDTEILTRQDDVMLIHPVDDEQIIEFSMPEVTLPVVPKPAQAERPLPYVPGSTFYVTPDSTRVRVLKIIVL